MLPQARDSRVAAKKKKPQQKAQRKPKGQRQRIPTDASDFFPSTMADDAIGLIVPPSSLPSAPPPSSSSGGGGGGGGAASQAPEAADLYKVFLTEPRVTPMEPSASSSSSRESPSSSSSSSASGASKWAWDSSPDQGGEQEAMPLWNPRTGFMTVRPEEAAAATGGNQADDASTSIISSSGSSSGAGPGGGARQGQLDDMRLSSALSVAGGAPADEAEGELPAVSKQAVLGSCVSTSGLMVFFGVLLRGYAQGSGTAGVLGSDPQLVAQLMRIPGGLESWSNMGLMLAAAGGVTAARALLLSQWREFGLATHRSNKQVLSPLGPLDVVLVSVLTGCSEEFLFRASLIPATFPDWRGVLLAGLVFGLLHNSGGRNPAFAAWAAVVGVLYGGVFVASGNLWVAAGAHSLGNMASAALWLSRNRKGEQ